MKTALIIPTINAGALWLDALEALDRQTVQPDLKILLDSESDDRTVKLATAHGFDVHPVLQKEYDHGLTRQRGVDLAADCDIVLLMTQDAVLATPQALEILIAPFDNPRIGAAYGRQRPRKEARPLEAFTRLHSYPSISRIKTMEDVPELGLHAAFCSDSFAAYRKSALLRVGGFPSTAFGEDMLVAAKLLLEGDAVAYCADAGVFHSHPVTFRESFSRGKQIGTLHRTHPWLHARFGSAQKAGSGYIKQGITFLAKESPWEIPRFIAQSAIKYAGFLAK